MLGPEDLLVEEGEEPEELHQLVLERSRGEEELRPVPQRVPERAGDLVPRPMGVPEAVGLVDDHQIPRELQHELRPAGREGLAGDDRPELIERVVTGAERPPIDDDRREVELVLELPLPLGAQGGGSEHEDASLSLRHQLGDDDAGLDGLPEAYLVGEHATATRERLERERGRLHLVRIEVDPCLREGGGEPIGGPSRLERQLLRQQPLMESRQRGFPRGLLPDRLRHSTPR